MRDFYEKLPNVKIALDFHSPGPELVIPNAWDPRESNPTLPRKAKMFYNFLFENAGAPEEYKFGSAIQTINQTANGTAIDWLSHERGIYSIAPELGYGERELNKNEFFIEDKERLQNLLVSNSGWIEYTLGMLFEKVQCKHRKSYVT